MSDDDLPLRQLRGSRSSTQRPVDFDEFWRENLDSARRSRWSPRIERVSSPLNQVEVFDVAFAGFDGEPVKAWFHRPIGTSPVPVIVRYVGYNCGRGLPYSVPAAVLAGYAVLSMDNRGQGAVSGYRGDTPDLGSLRELGLAVRGLGSRESYYYRRLFTDAAMAIDTARDLPHVDSRVAVAGVSQGGGIALAASGIAADVSVALIDVPFLCDIPRAMTLSKEGPYTELVGLLATYPESTADALAVLRYFDGTNFATAASADALFSVGLMDNVCPPSSVFAAYNAYAGPKALSEYPFAGHEGGSFTHEALQLEWLSHHMPI